MVDVQYEYEAIPVSDEVYDQHRIGDWFKGGVIVDGISDYNEDLNIDLGLLIIRKEYEV